MVELLRLVAWTPSEAVINVEPVQWVRVTLATDELLTIWPGHAALLAETASEAVYYADEEGTHSIDLPSGLLHVQDGVVIILLAGTLDQVVEPEGERSAETKRLARAMLSTLKGRQMP